MRTFAIVTDATADLPADYIRDHSITVLPMEFTLWDKSYTHYPDYRDLPSDAFYDALKAGAAIKTTQINLITFTDCFESLVKYGMDVLYIGFSSGISGTYNVACMAAADVREDYPDAKVICIDSLGTVMGLGLLVEKADEMRKGGKSIEETAQWLRENALRVHHRFIVDDLQHLRRGGRVSPLAASLGTALNIKPVLEIDAEGKLEVCAKERGTKKAIEHLIKKFEETCDDYEQKIVVMHASNPLGAMTICDELKKRGAVNTEVTRLGPIIGAHTGPGLLGFVYFGTPRK